MKKQVLISICILIAIPTLIFSIIFFLPMAQTVSSDQQQVRGTDSYDPIQYGDLSISLLNQTENTFCLNFTIKNVTFTEAKAYFIIYRDEWLFRVFYDSSPHIIDSGFTSEGDRYYIYQEKFYDYIQSVVTYNFSVRINQLPYIVSSSILLTFVHFEPFYNNALFILGLMALVFLIVGLHSTRTKTIYVDQPVIEYIEPMYGRRIVSNPFVTAIIVAFILFWTAIVIYGLWILL